MSVAAIKLGDLGHPTKALQIHIDWSNLLAEEFFLQGDREKEEGLPVSFLCDRDSVVLAKSQIGFLEFMIFPLLDAIALSVPSAEVLANKTRLCHSHWKAVNDAAAAEEKKE